jgi:hypothetical protein
MSANSTGVTVPLAATQPGVRLLSRAVLTATLLGVILQWAIARVYAGLIVESFGGERAAQSGGGLAIPVSYLLTAISCAACALYCQKRSAASRVIVLIQLVAVIVPLQALVAARFEFARPMFAIGVTLAYLSTLALVALTPEVRVPRASARVSLLVLIAATLVSAYVLWALLGRGGLGRISFDLTAVYEVREEFLARIAPLMGYLVPWQGYVLNPALLLLALRRRSLLLGAAGLTLQLLLFGTTGFRAFLLLPALLLVFYLIARRRQLVSLVLAGMLAVIGFALLLYAWLDQPLIPLLLVDRVIVVPAEIHYWYYDFFGVHRQALLQLSQSILAPLAASHYREPIAEVIGWTYMGNAASANVGLFGDAYANFGFAGCAVFAVLFAMVLKAVDAAGRATDGRVAAALVAVPAFELVNSGLLTTLLTHGLALTMLTLWALAPAAPPPRPAAGDTA